MHYLIDVILLFAVLLTCKGQDVILTATSACYNVNGDMSLEAEYNGSTTVNGVLWTITGGSSNMYVAVSTCSPPFSIPTGFPDGRMLYDCSSAPKYRLTVRTLESADFTKTWGVDFTLSTGSTASGIQHQTVVQCENVNENDSDFPIGAIIGIAFSGIFVLACIGCIVYCQKHKKHLEGTKPVNDDQTGPGNASTPNPENVDFLKTFNYSTTPRDDYTQCCIKVTRTEGNDLLQTATSGIPIYACIIFNCRKNPGEMVLLDKIELNTYSEQTFYLPLRPDGKYDFQTVDIGIVKTERAMPGWSFQQVHAELPISEKHEFEEEKNPLIPLHRTDALRITQRFTSRTPLYLKKNTTLKMRFKYERKQKTESRHRDLIATEKWSRKQVSTLKQ